MLIWGFHRLQTQFLVMRRLFRKVNPVFRVLRVPKRFSKGLGNFRQVQTHQKTTKLQNPIFVNFLIERFLHLNVFQGAVYDVT